MDKSGLLDLRRKLIENSISSVALPPLGCGNGGLNWNEVKTEIQTALGDLSIEIFVFEPSVEILSVLQKEEKRSASHLTKPRAMLLHLLYRYRALGEFTSEFAAEKLSYFLQRFGEKQLKLDFQKGLYGPYSGKVRHVLFAINGYYLKGYEQKDAKPFEPLELIVEKLPEVKAYLDTHLSIEEKKRLETVGSFIEGFESPYGLELLATVDFLMQGNKSHTLENIQAGLDTWSQRKRNLFEKKHLQLALEHINKYTSSLFPEKI